MDKHDFLGALAERLYRILRNEGFRGSGSTLRRISDPVVLCCQLGECSMSRFDGGEISQTGMGLLFQHPIIHEGAEVTRGTKYVIRTDLMYR